MSDCPWCGWEYEQFERAALLRPVGARTPPLVYDGELRVAAWTDPVDGRRTATGTHMASEHWLRPEVLALGPLEVVWDVTQLTGGKPPGRPRIR